MGWDPALTVGDTDRRTKMIAMTEENNEPSSWDELLPVLKGFTAPDRKEEAPSPPNIFQLAGFPNRETVASRLFAWLLDPDGSHGFGSAPLEAFLACVFPHDDAIDPQSAVVSTEVATDPDEDTGHSKYLDILIELKDRSIVIENKVDATLYNKLDVYYRYARDARKDNGHSVTTHVVVLHKHEDPSIREHEYDGLQWGRNLFDLTYDDLFDSILQHLGPTLMNADNRAIDILKQFIENYSYIRNQEETMAADEKMTQFLDQAQGHAAGVRAFLESYQQYLKGMREKMEPIWDTVPNSIPELFENVRLADSWIWPKKYATEEWLLSRCYSMQLTNTTSRRKKTITCDFWCEADGTITFRAYLGAWNEKKPNYVSGCEDQPLLLPGSKETLQVTCADEAIKKAFRDAAIMAIEHGWNIRHKTEEELAEDN